ncbi:MAG: chorismate mutase [candidate division Zixibacteria bacterium]
MRTRGVRGAIVVKENTRQAIFDATVELLEEILQKNSIPTEEIASIFLTATTDLDAEFPAYAARRMGLTSVPLLCAQEMEVPGAMRSVIRALIHFNTEKKQSEIINRYLGGAQKLRPDQGVEN